MSKDGTLLRIFLASVRWEKLLILSSETLSSHFWHVLLMVVMSCVLFARKGCVSTGNALVAYRDLVRANIIKYRLIVFDVTKKVAAM